MDVRPRLVFDGGSMAIGAIAAAVYFGALSPWYLLVCLVLLVRFRAFELQLFQKQGRRRSDP